MTPPALHGYAEARALVLRAEDYVIRKITSIKTCAGRGAAFPSLQLTLRIKPDTL
jgi:hypothetical protein